MLVWILMLVIIRGVSGLIAVFIMNKKRFALSTQVLWLLLILSTGYIGLIMFLLYYNDRT